MNSILKLIKKDLIYIITAQRKLIFIAFLLTFVFSIQSPITALIMPTITGYLFTYGVFAYEEKNKTHLLNVALPVTRKELCQSKYLASIFYMLVGMLVAVAGMITGSIIRGEVRQEILYLLGTVSSMLIAVALIYNAVILPIIIWLGAIKCKQVMLTLYIVTYFGMLMLANKRETVMQSFLGNANGMMLASILVMSILIFSLSYVIGVRLYKTKDFC